MARVKYETIPLFNYPALSRWHLDPRRLPAGAVVLNRADSLWDRYGSYALVAAIFIVLETVLVSILLFQRRRRKVAERALRDSERNYRTIFENSSLGMFQIDADGRFVKANEALAGIFGFETPDELVVALPDARAAVLDLEEMNRQRDAVDREGLIEDKEFRVQDRLGRTVWISLNARKVLDSKGDFAYYEGTIDDITARKTAEATIRAALAEKESLLHELNHRTRNNMQMILSIISLETRKIEDLPTLALFEATQNRIRAMETVHDILIGADNLSCVDLGRYVGALGAMYAEQASVHRLSIVANIPEEPILVAIDTAVPFGLALGELFANSIKHAFPGERRGRIELDLRRLESGSIEVDFGDDGVGLPPGLDAATAESLGLTLVRELVVRQLGGRVTVANGSGTRYRLAITERACPWR